MKACITLHLITKLGSMLASSFHFIATKFIIPCTYYKHLKKGAHQSLLGRKKNAMVSGRLASTSSKTEIHIQQNRNLFWTRLSS